MHYFGTMYELRRWSDFKLALAALISLIAAWNVPVLGVLIFPAFVFLFEIGHRSTRSFWKFYGIMSIWNGATTYWIGNAHPLGVLATVVLNGALMAFVLWLGFRSLKVWVKFPWFKRNNLWTYLPVFAAWIAFEKLHDHWDLAFPWLNLGNTFSGLPILVQWYQWLGVTGGTLWVLLVAMALSEWISGRWRLHAATLLILVPVLTSLTLRFWPSQNTKNASISVAVVQPNINSYTEKWELPEETQIEKVRGLLQQRLKEDRVDLIVLPETFLPKSRMENTYGADKEDLVFHNVLDTYGNSAIFGATTYDFQDAANPYNRPIGNRYYTMYNSALFRTMEMPSAQIYHKGKLVVGGETMPFGRWLKPWLGDWVVDLGGASATLGISQERVVFEDGNGLKLGPIICWENEFSNYTTEYARQGANLFAVITNDGWWGNTQGHVQHMRFAGLRAIENGKWVVRSANTGISCIIDNKGVVYDSLGWDEEGVIVMDVPLVEGQTLYTTTGDWIGQLMVMLFVLNIALLLLSRFFRLKPR